MVARFAQAADRATLVDVLHNESKYLLAPSALVSLNEGDLGARRLEADADLTEAIQLCRGLAAEFPDNADYKNRLDSLLNLQAKHFGGQQP